MRGYPSQWEIGSQWIADGGVYPGMGETIGMAGTSPERADGGMWNDGGGVGDPPFDELQAASFDSAVGAGGNDGVGYAYPAVSGTAFPMDRGGDEGEGDFDNPLTGLLIFGGLTLAFFWGMHRFRIGDDAKFASIKGTAGDLAIIIIGAGFGLPLLKSTAWGIADFFDWQPLYDTASFVNGS